MIYDTPLSITVLLQKACCVVINVDPEGHIFVSHPHTTNGFYFLLTIKYCIFMLKKGSQKLLNMGHDMMTSHKHNNGVVGIVPIQPMYSFHVTAWLR